MAKDWIVSSLRWEQGKDATVFSCIQHGIEGPKHWRKKEIESTEIFKIPICRWYDY